MITIEVTFDDADLAQVVTGAERQKMTVSDYIRSAVVRASRRRMPRAERDTAILEYSAANWSAHEIANHLRVDRQTVARVVAQAVKA